MWFNYSPGDLLQAICFFTTPITMSRLPSKSINIFISLEQDILKGYFNPQDPTPLYKRQLSHEFEQYIMTSIRSVKRDSTFIYKISYTKESDEQFIEPLIYAIRLHFADNKKITIQSFEKFKRRSYMLLFISLFVVMVCQGFLPLLIQKEENGLKTGLLGSLDVLCWVILWKPIEKLIFYWNPFLKDISIMDRLQKAEIKATLIDD